MRVTINDIAKAAGYSKTTVSFAFNDPSRISQTARDKILGVARELGYVPDPVARTLSSRRHGTIGVLLPQEIPLALKNPYLVNLLTGVGEVCGREDLTLTLLPPTRGSVLNTVREAAVDGLIAVGINPEPDVLDVVRHRHVPFVTVDAQADPGIPSVTINDREAALHGMQYIVGNGHRKIAVVLIADERLPDQEDHSSTGSERVEGFRHAVGEAGLAWEGGDIVQLYAPCSLPGGEELADTLVRDHQSVTAVVTMSDVTAIGLLHGLRRHGLRVPWDISVLGFDDIPEASIVSPALSTIWQPAEEKGLRAAELLIRLIAKKTVEDRVQFRCRLVIRESTAAAPSR